jgi:polar amino acid transport system substrate-binding protein
VLERVTRTGELVAGTRGDAKPFAYRDASGNLVGFSVDLLGEIRARLEAERKGPVAMRLREVTPADRVRLVAGHDIDIECGITTATWEREQRIDFTIPFFENGTRILAPRSRFKSLDELAGRRVGVVRNSTTREVVTQSLVNPQIVEVADMDEGFRLLAGGGLDALANIGIVLRSRLETSDLKARFVLLPRTGALAWEAISCMVPEDDSGWRDFVDRTIADLLTGITDFKGRWVDIYDRWFGPQGDLYYPLDRETAQRLANSAYWLR